MRKNNHGVKKYFIIVILFFITGLLFAQSADSRYDAGMNLPFNAKAGDVNPQTGNLSLSVTDMALPGRGGLSFSFSRIWSLNQSNVFAMGQNSFDGSNVLTSDTIERYNHLGVGWSSSLPYIFDDNSSSTLMKSLVVGGNVFQLDLATLAVYNANESNIIGYDLLDQRIYSGATGSAITYGDFNSGTLPADPGVHDIATDSSEYVLILKDNSKYYFRPDGRVMMQQDKTGLNKIWYFYEDYTDELGNPEARLSLVVDTVGREIEFHYNAADNLSHIQWAVVVGTKTGTTRSYDPASPVTRQVSFGYENAETTYTEVGDLASLVSNKRTPYALVSVADPMNNVTKYDYTAGVANFSYDSAKSYAANVNLLLTAVTDKYTESGFKNKRCFEYTPPESGMHVKYFYKGYMEYYKISRQYYRDRHNDRILNDTRYLYYEAGYKGDWNRYESAVQTGNITTTYTYTLSDDPARHHVLASLKVESVDGFLQKNNYVYDSNRAKILDEVFRMGTWIYSEKYQYDKKGNLKRKEEKNGLVTTVQYDDTYSVPTEEVKILHVDGQEVEYKTSAVVNSYGQVTEQYIYLDKEGTITPVRAAKIDYDAYGNVIKQTDVLGNETNTVYDSTYNLFPVKTWQDVTIAAWSGGGDVHANWQTAPDTTQTVQIRTWKVFNSDGTPWLEIDNEGYVVEHYYDALGTEIEIITPDGDDINSFALGGGDFEDFYTDYLSANFNTYFGSRINNPGSRMEVDYQNEFVKTTVDSDVTLGQIKISGQQGDGLGHTEEEIQYKADGTIHAVKKMTYDDLGQMIVLTDSDAGTGYTEIEINGTTVQRHDKTWIIQHDDLGRQVKVLYPDTTPGVISLKSISYDDLTNSITTVDPEGITVVERKDWNGNLIEMEARGDSSTPQPEWQLYSYTYDELNRKTSFTDPRGIVTTYIHDERNLLLEQNYGAESGSDFMKYNDLGQLIEKRDRKEQVAVLTYDELGRNTRLDHYKKDGDANGTDDYSEGIIDYSVDTVYDFRGNAVRVDNQNIVEHYTHNYANLVINLDRRLKDQSLRQEVASVWGGTEGDQVFSFGYEYNDAGIVTKMTYPDGSEHNFDYDSDLGQLQRIQDGLVDFVSGFSYNLSGVVTRMDYANGTWQTWDFDNRKRISHINISNTGGSLEDLTYSLNGSGNILSINDHEYDYDGLNRIVYAKTLIPGNKDYRKLVAASFGTAVGVDPIDVNGVIWAYNPDADLNSDGRVNGWDHAEANFITNDSIYDIESFEYDKNGNRTKLVQNGDLYTYEYGIRNRLEKVYRQKKDETSAALFVEYEYDGNGNTTKRTIHTDVGGEVITFEYDTMNRVVLTTKGAEVTEYFYDNVGNRFIKKDNESTTLYLRHGQIAVAMDIEIEVDQTTEKGTINRYVLSGDLLAGRITATVNADDSTVLEKSYYHQDHLNSTKMVTDESGSVVVNYTYRAFGEQLKRLGDNEDEVGDEAKYSYGGKELDEGANLYYFNARYYDATIGRFINVDPIQDGMNWYVYCSNNPLSMVDPTGLKGGKNDDYGPWGIKSVSRPRKIYPGYSVLWAFTIKVIRTRETDWSEWESKKEFLGELKKPDGNIVNFYKVTEERTKRVQTKTDSEEYMCIKGNEPLGKTITQGALNAISIPDPTGLATLANMVVDMMWEDIDASLKVRSTDNSYNYKGTLITETKVNYIEEPVSEEKTNDHKK